MIREEQVLELNSTAEEKKELDPKTQATGQEQGSGSGRKYKTIFNCCYSEGQE